jgi:hypothetical protein
VERRRADIVFIHRIEGNHCRAKVGGADAHFDVYATIFDARPDSPEFRDQVKALLESASGAEDFDLRNLRFSLGGFVPRQFADEDRIIVTRSAASDEKEMKARVRVVFDIERLSRHDLDPYFEFETNLENHLEALKVGFVDGNDIGMGEYTVYCFGKDKKELKTVVSDFAKKCGPQPHKVV